MGAEGQCSQRGPSGAHQAPVSPLRRGPVCRIFCGAYSPPSAPGIPSSESLSDDRAS